MELPEIWNLVFQELLPKMPLDAKEAAIAIDCLASIVLLRVEMGGYGPSETLVDVPTVVHEAFAS